MLGHNIAGGRRGGRRDETKAEQKIVVGNSVGTSSRDITKTSYPSGPLPPQTKLNFAQNGWKSVHFFTTTLLGGVGE